MEPRFLTPVHSSLGTPDIYADKSALVLQWLLLTGTQKEKEVFSLREVATESFVSLGLVQRIFEYLIRQGILQAVGVRTAKKFKLLRPKKLLISWAEHYSITNKCKMWNYRTAKRGREEILKVLDSLMRSGYWKQTCLALHTAAQVREFKNTNLQTIELYILEPEIRERIEQELELEPQERGYEVLLIKPYYKAMLSSRKGAKLITSETLKVPGSHLFCSHPLLTYLDLYNFPVRGREQAEFMAQRDPDLRRIFKRD